MSLTLAEARARAAQLSDVSYDLELDLTSDGPTFGSRVRVGFASTGPETFLEVTGATDLRVEVDGEPVAAAYDGRRVSLTGLRTDGRTEVLVDARLPYVTDGDGMHTFTDPADGERYVSAYVGMDIAQRVFACFDQNDLKAPVTLSVRAPEAWTVLANGRATATGPEWSFATTPPIPPAMFVVCAGPWHSVTWEHAGLPFGWHARRSLAAELDRDAAELRRITEACFDHYARVFDEPYAFDSYDQAFVPGQNWGALETPGCVTYRDEILPVGRVSEGEAWRRAIVIAHEMAHMWFGDLVTMTWWEDTWLQESFADYMGFEVAEAAAGFAGTWVDFTAGRKTGAYDADQRRSTHPVAPLAEEVGDVDEAANNFDSISYAKGSSSLRQLVTWLGEEDFLAGVNAYLRRHRFGNATLADFVAALDSATDRDVRDWVERWLRTTGFDTVRVTREGDEAVLTREGSRPHRVRVATYDDGLRPAEDTFVDVGDEPGRVRAAAVVVPNAGGETYARLRLDPQSWAAVEQGLSSFPDAGVRAVLWSTAFDLVRCGELAVEDHLDLLGRHLPGERHVATVESVLAWSAGPLVRRHVRPEQAAGTIAAVAAACTAGLATGPEDEVALALTRTLAATTRDAALLQRWLADRRTDAGVDLDPRLRWSVIARLAALGGIDVAGIEAERTADGTVVGQLGSVRALAARPDAEAKAAAWAAMFEDPDVSNRAFTHGADGFWDPEQREVLEPYVARYLADAPRVARERGQAFSQLVGQAFPALPLTPADLDALRTALEGDVPTVLRRAWEDALDDRT